MVFRTINKDCYSEMEDFQDLSISYIFILTLTLINLKLTMTIDYFFDVMNFTMKYTLLNVKKKFGHFIVKFFNEYNNEYSICSIILQG
jgi:hypothetical protein